MTSLPHNPEDRNHESSPMHGEGLFDLDPQAVASGGSDSFGTRLRAAREARGLSLDACGHALRLPSRVLRQLEEDNREGIDSKVYLASYMEKYGRYLGLDDDCIASEIGRVKQVEAPLVATGGISHSRYLFDRYATYATYAILTAVIVVPMIWLGVRGTLDKEQASLTPLDASPVVQQDLLPANAASSGTAVVVDQPVVAAGQPGVVPVASQQAPRQEQPLMASMAPFPGLDRAEPASPSIESAAVGMSGHRLDLSLTAPCWVEVTAADGTRLEYGLLPAGTTKVYHGEAGLDVRIGNSAAAEVRLDGQPVTLDQFAHANVSHFEVQIRDGKASAVNL